MKKSGDEEDSIVAKQSVCLQKRAAPKYEIQEWFLDHEKMGKGVTQTEEEEKRKKLLEMQNPPCKRCHVGLAEHFFKRG